MWLAMLWFFVFKQKTAYEMRISDWSSDVCSSDLIGEHEKREAEAPQCGDRSGALQTRIRETERCENAGEGERPWHYHQPGEEVANREGENGSRTLNRKQRQQRSAERRVGKEGGSTCRSGWRPSH